MISTDARTDLHSQGQVNIVRLHLYLPILTTSQHCGTKTAGMAQW